MTVHLPHLTQAQEFTANVFLARFPIDAEFVTLVDMVSQGAPEVEVHHSLSFLAPEDIAHRMDALVETTEQRISSC
jgi:hypothetical protein